MWFKLAFAFAFIFATAVAATTARLATRRHGGSLNQLTHEVRGLVFLQDHRLVTTGPYRFIRHPIYASFIAIMLLVLPLSANWALGLSGLLLVISIAAVRIPIEEDQLHKRFGKDWEEYRDQTGSLLPTPHWPQ